MFSKIYVCATTNNISPMEELAIILLLLLLKKKEEEENQEASDLPRVRSLARVSPNASVLYELEPVHILFYLELDALIQETVFVSNNMQTNIPKPVAIVITPTQ